MSDNNRKNPHEMKQDDEYHNPLERFTQIFASNKKSENQKDPSSLQNDQSRTKPSNTSFHDDDFDLSFLEAEFENNLTSDLPLNKQEKQYNLHKTSNKTTSDTTLNSSFKNQEKNSFLSKEEHSLPSSHDEEQILDALSPLPIQKNLSSQNKTAWAPARSSFEKNKLDAPSKNFFFDGTERPVKSGAPPERGEQESHFSQKIVPQQNHDDNQNLHSASINHPYEVSADQENWIEEYYTNAPTPSMKANADFASANLISEKKDSARNETTSDFPPSLDSAQTNKPSDLKDFLQENHTDSYPQFYEEKFSKQETSAAQTPPYVDSQAQYINNTENISKQNNEKEVAYKQKNLNERLSSSGVFKDTQKNHFFAHNTTVHRDTPPPNVDTYKFAEEIVEKTAPIMVPEVPYEIPEYNVPTDGLKEEFADVLNVGNIPAENFSQPKQQDEVFNEIFHQTIQNSKENASINRQEQGSNHFSANNMGYYSSSLTENLSYTDADEPAIHSSTPPPLKNSIVSKTLTKSVILLILIAVGFVSYSRFFMSSQKNESTPIIHADNTPFKFKQESTETKSDVAYNLDIYKQTTGQTEKQENTQQFLIDNSEHPEDLAALNQQESPSLSPSSVDDSDVEDAVTEALNHTVPTQEVQTVIVKQDGTVMLAPMNQTEKKTADEHEAEKIEQTTVDQPQKSQSVSSQFSNTKNKETEDNLRTDIDQIISENISTANVEKKTENSFVPLPSHTKSNSQVQTPAASREIPPVQVRTQNSENYYVQLASQPTQALAQDSLKKMKSKFGFLIGTRPLNIQSALIPGKGTYYRVRIQAQNRSEAINLCEDIKSSGGSCFITR
ncbi:SPOR domain-containing protein [Bartonella senegalensis]|uniref:SPOR domain-containing protein n=1 Tax=Bartonella senegalensis TaxID=1468418 RepID=UPI0005512818|nr:SPOR domain-containing protein [Bartonella senegalensis]